MSDFDQTVGKHGPATAFSFHGNWIDFMKIAGPNLLLTIVTLGIYRFWGTTRERQYQWGQTEFIDERLEWTGTGMELFVGFIMVFFLIGIPLAFLQFGAQAMILRGYLTLAVFLSVLAFFVIFYFTGVAYFRALRYRLSRTYWRGIRGGSDDNGLNYGVSYVWKYIGAMLPIYLLYPWASISLWNERWSAMSFGPYRFESGSQWTMLMKRYMLFYLVPFLLFLFAAFVGYQEASGGGRNMGAGTAVAFGGFAVLLILALYIILPVAALLYYSKYVRVAVGGLKLGDLEFEFKARSPDWILFFLANWAIWGLAAGLAFVPISMVMSAGAFNPETFRDHLSTAVISTLVISGVIGVIAIGLANALIRYRTWKFFVSHMEAYGQVNLDQMSQSPTAAPTQGEGLLDAFDVGAF